MSYTQHIKRIAAPQGGEMRYERGLSFGPVDAACKGKMPYRSYDDAARVVKHQKGRIIKRSEKLQIYRCAYCRHWHMGGGPA